MAGIGLGDRRLGAEVRRLTLKKIQTILQDDYEDKELQKQVILKLASTVLPRINEHSGGEGDDGEIKPILVKFIDGNSTDNRDTSGVQAVIQ
jgi:hypothetical protein